ncbi:DUF2185 domain-containing protein [Leptospira sarikeiensis]|uniref:DUF2185 domain-containing protein n=1 Tax=Leptospira sarikeiensis TaxID=2484943 RepID=A0A4V3JSE1_9LEPT|nr:DUF2185 domain-containing protein [Leptospira sarikeiensis]TGL64240.1 DUF2185 domain-containing protein [Leptospira sarikeiensis]
MKKKFKLKAEEIKTIISGLGACLATDQITVEGLPVHFMYRETPDNDMDSGWRFFSGMESEEYISDPKNTSVFDVNTIANYDESILPFLHSEINTAFEKDPKTKKFHQVDDFEFPE